jgi:Tol biopolymer transport system component
MNSNRKTREILICSLVVAGILLVTGSDANADFVFGTPTNLGSTVNSPAWDGTPDITADGLTLFFDSARPGGYGGGDLWVATRETLQNPWGEPVNLGPEVNSSAVEGCPGISADGLKLYLVSTRPGGSGNMDLWVTKRSGLSESWGEPVNLGTTVNSSADDAGPVISSDGLSLLFSSNRAGGHGGQDLYVSTRATTDDPWGDPVNLGPTVNSSAWDYEPALSPDGLSLFFGSGRSGGYGSDDVWVTRRETTDDPWVEPVNLGPEVNSSSGEGAPFISPDGSTLYFGSNRSGGSGGADIWQVPIEPIVDFNGDGIVDSADLCILFDCWGTDESTCDIGPTPFGDGIVDVKDMVVFAEHLLGETLPVDLVAHWKLDELEGIYTKDSVSDNDAIVIGSPASLPTGGMVDGALEFDGIMDCLITDSVVNPEHGPFRVFAWIKGGAPGQVVLSQSAGVDWLATDPIEGSLMTELAGAGSNSSPLLSQTIVTDGEWHLIGFAWNGSHRTLYVDNVAVAKDTQDGLNGSSMSLYIGAGKMMQPGTYFSGLIDDVRVYSRAVKP